MLRRVKSFQWINSRGSQIFRHRYSSANDSIFSDSQIIHILQESEILIQEKYFRFHGSIESNNVDDCTTSFIGLFDFYSTYGFGQ